MKVHRMILAAWTILGLGNGDLTKQENVERWKINALPPPSQMKPLTGFDIPVLKLIKRQVRNFREGSTASITLVFRASKPTTVRWFMLHPKWRPGQSEVRNLVPVEVDPSCRVSFVSSGDVYATTLAIPHYKEKFERDFETIFTLEDGTMQYQVRTYIEKNGNGQEAENINSPEWTMIPPEKWHFPLGTHLTVPCRVFIPRERSGVLNELVLFQAIPSVTVDSKGRKHPTIQYEWLYEANKRKTSRSQKDLRKGIVLECDRIEWKFHNHLHAKYHVQMTTENTTKTHDGVYQCALEREMDKQYVISSLSHMGNPSPFAKEAIAVMTSCEKGNFDKETNILKLAPLRGTCLRCRGYGSPRPKVGLYRKINGEEALVTDSSSVRVRKYVNVLEAGIAEATYIFRRPNRNLEGNYTCKAQNHHALSNASFEILVN